jgi:hypothetical protein
MTPRTSAHPTHCTMDCDSIIPERISTLATPALM